MNSPVNLAELRQKAKLPVAQAGGNTVQAFFDHNKSAITAVLPKHLSAERMMKIALGALRTTPTLRECSVESLFGSVVWCAQLGLEPNTPLGHAYLIPFKDRKKGTTEVQCIIGFKGLIDLARRSGQIVSIAAHEVCEQDDFDFAYGLTPKLEHKPALRARGEVIAYYAVAELKGGGNAFEVMSVEQIEQIRDREGSNAWKDEWVEENGRKKKSGKRVKAKSPWWDYPIEMGRKTVLRRLCKYLPISVEMAEAIAADEAPKQDMTNVLQGDFTVVAGEDDAEPEAAEQPQQPQAKPTKPAPTTAGPTFEDAAKAVQAGDFDAARDIARSLTADQQTAIEQAITNAGKRPAKPTPTPADFGNME